MTKKPIKGNGSEPEKTGYGKPPKEFQFKKDKCPNPGGRKGKPSTTDAFIIGFLEQKVGGKTVYERVYAGMAKAGIAGNERAGRFLIERYEQAKKGRRSAASDDEEGIEAIRRLLKDDPTFWRDILDPDDEDGSGK